MMERKRWHTGDLLFPENNKARHFVAGLYVYVWVSKYWKPNFHTQY